MQFAELSFPPGESELVVNKIYATLQAFSEEADKQSVSDESMYLSLGNVILNGPITSDEIAFILYVYALSKGGLSIDEAIPLNKIPFLPQVPIEYITLSRAMQICGIVLNQAVQTKYYENLIISGKATEMIRDVSYQEAMAKKAVLNKNE